MPSISIILISDDNEAVTSACLAAWRQQTLAANQFEVLVAWQHAANADPFRKQFPAIRGNYRDVTSRTPGLAHALNIAIAEANGDLLVFCRAEYSPARDFLEQAFRFHETHANVEDIMIPQVLPHSGCPTTDLAHWALSPMLEKTFLGGFLALKERHCLANDQSRQVSCDYTNRRSHDGNVYGVWAFSLAGLSCKKALLSREQFDPRFSDWGIDLDLAYRLNEQIQLRLFKIEQAVLFLQRSFDFASEYRQSYLEGHGRLRLLRAHSRPEVLGEMHELPAVTKETLDEWEAMQPQMLEYISWLEQYGDQLDDNFSAKYGDITYRGHEALWHAYKLTREYALAKGWGDCAAGVDTQTGISHLSALLDRHYTNFQHANIFISPCLSSAATSLDTCRPTPLTPVAAGNPPGKRVLLFYPHNPYPPKTGAHQGVLSAIRALKALGCEVTFFSSDLYQGGDQWTPRLARAFEVAWGIKVHIYLAEKAERE